jgi:hypothetical protein
MPFSGNPLVWLDPDLDGDRSGQVRLVGCPGPPSSAQRSQPLSEALAHHYFSNENSLAGALSSDFRPMATYHARLSAQWQTFTTFHSKKNLAR